MVGYNVLEKYLRTIGIFVWHSKGMLKKIILGGPHFSEWGGGGHKKCTPGPLKKKNFFNPFPNKEGSLKNTHILASVPK